MREFACEDPMSGPIAEMSGALSETQLFETTPTRAFDFGPVRRVDAVLARWEGRSSRRKRRAEKAAASVDADPVADELAVVREVEPDGQAGCASPDGAYGSSVPSGPSEETAAPEFPARRFDCAAELASMADALKPPCGDDGGKSPALYAAPFRLDGDSAGAHEGRMAMVVWWEA